MSLRHALLALLEAGPMTGYELAKQFDTSVAYVWHAPHSQIYPELRRLEAGGFVTATELPRGERGTKRAYSLAPDGAEELRRWVTDVDTPARPRDAAYLKATYLEYASYDDARRQFREHRDHYRQLQAHWERHVAALERRETALLQRRLEAAPESAHDAIAAYKVHTYQGLVDRARTEVAWAERGLDLVDRLARRGTTPPGEPVHPLTDDAGK
jgi:PadR family transcriptional regulator, regulatory protein AphA